MDSIKIKSNKGTKPGIPRCFTSYRWEIIFVPQNGKIIHRKFVSSVDIIKSPDIPIGSKQHLHYYVKGREKLKGLKKPKYTIDVKRINELIIK
jgi:hypothetical protein